MSANEERERRSPKEVRSARTVDPAVGVGIVLVGCLLSFYLVGLFLIPVGAWLWKRSLVV